MLKVDCEVSRPRTISTRLHDRDGVEEVHADDLGRGGWVTAARLGDGDGAGVGGDDGVRAGGVASRARKSSAFMSKRSVDGFDGERDVAALMSARARW